MKKSSVLLLFTIFTFTFSCGNEPGIPVDVNGMIIDHEYANVTGITGDRVQHAKDNLRIAYWHTSHGSQLIVGCGMDYDESSDMDEFYGNPGWYFLDLEDEPACPGGLYIDEDSSHSIGQYDQVNWDLDVSIDMFDQDVRNYLAASEHQSINVVMASWCGGVSGASESQIDHYLDMMNSLESDYPGIIFVYMTGHADGTGLDGNLHLRNQQIRSYCQTNNKWLFDFYDIDCHDPDGNYYGDRLVDDECNYDADGDGNIEFETVTDSESGQEMNVALAPDSNWATEWQEDNPAGWWNCPTDWHTRPVNRNQKARAAWQLWCLLAEN